MSEALRQAIAKGAAVRAVRDPELSLLISFAKIELAELQAGIRELQDCSAVEKLASEIAKAKK